MLPSLHNVGQLPPQSTPPSVPFLYAIGAAWNGTGSARADTALAVARDQAGELSERGLATTAAVDSQLHSVFHTVLAAGSLARSAHADTRQTVASDVAASQVGTGVAQVEPQSTSPLIRFQTIVTRSDRTGKS